MENKNCIWASLAAGVIGGLAGAFTMTQFQSLWSTTAKALSHGEGSGDEDVDATRNMAQAISKHTTGHTLSQPEIKTAASAVHYGVGVLMGAVYGVAAETLPLSALGRGTLYGGAVWLFADEIAVPAFGMGSPPSKTPLSSQLSALASHVVYGFTTDFVRRLVRF